MAHFYDPAKARTLQKEKMSSDEELEAYIKDQVTQKFTFTSGVVALGDIQFSFDEPHISYFAMMRNQEVTEAHVKSWPENAENLAYRAFTRLLLESDCKNFKETEKEKLMEMISVYCDKLVADDTSTVGAAAKATLKDELVLYSMHIFSIKTGKHVTPSSILASEDVWKPGWEVKFRFWFIKGSLKQLTDDVKAKLHVGLSRPPPPARFKPIDSKVVIEFCSRPSDDPEGPGLNRMVRKQMEAPTCDAVVGHEMWGFHKNSVIERFHKAMTAALKVAKGGKPFNPPPMVECTKWRPIDARFHWNPECTEYMDLIRAWEAYEKSSAPSPKKMRVDTVVPDGSAVSNAQQDRNSNLAEQHELNQNAEFWCQRLEELVPFCGKRSAARGLQTSFYRCIVLSEAAVVVNGGGPSSYALILSAETPQWRTLSDECSFASPGLVKLIADAKRANKWPLDDSKHSKITTTDMRTLTRTLTHGKHTVTQRPFAAYWCAEKERLVVNWEMLEKYHQSVYNEALLVVHEIEKAFDSDRHGGLRWDQRHLLYMHAKDRAKKGCPEEGDADILKDDLFGKVKTKWTAWQRPPLNRTPRATRVRPFRPIFEGFQNEIEALPAILQTPARDSVMVWEGDAGQGTDPARWVIYMESCCSVHGLYYMKDHFLELSEVDGTTKYVYMDEVSDDAASNAAAAAELPAERASIYGEHVEDKQQEEDLASMHGSTAAAHESM